MPSTGKAPIWVTSCEWWKINVANGETMKRASLSLFVVLTMSVFAALAQAGEAIVIKFSHVVANDTAKGKGALKFKELAEKYTSGKVKIDVYPNSALYKDKEELDALQIGAVQMLAPAVSKFGPLGVRDFDVLELPFMFDDAESLH